MHEKNLIVCALSNDFEIESAIQQLNAERECRVYHFKDPLKYLQFLEDTDVDVEIIDYELCVNIQTTSHVLRRAIQNGGYHLITVAQQNS